MGEIIFPILMVGMFVIGLPWLILHYVSKWKSNASLTTEDESLLDDLHETARRLDERFRSIERILTAENPHWREIVSDQSDIGIEDQTIDIMRRTHNDRA